jgi:hypothetical protein
VSDTAQYKFEVELKARPYMANCDQYKTSVYAQNCVKDFRCTHYKASSSAVQFASEFLFSVEIGHPVTFQNFTVA